MNEPVPIFEKDGIEYLKYQPGLFRLYAKCYTKDETPPYFSRIIHRIRMTREMIFAHYFVIYLKKDGKILGHLVVSRGGTRIAVSKKEDIVIGPIWTVPSERGKGAATEAIHTVLHSLGIPYRYAYEYINDDNAASVRTVEKNGYKLLYRACESGLMKTIRRDDNGNILLYRFDRDRNS